MRMMRLITLLIALCMAQRAHAWSETALELKTPDGVSIEGEAEIRQVIGYFCPTDFHAQTLWRYLTNSHPVQVRDIESAYSKCYLDRRNVFGVFSHKEDTVIFVRMLSDIREYAYYVATNLAGKRLQDARKR